MSQCQACGQDLSALSQNLEQLHECPFCGVVFAKLQQRVTAQKAAPPRRRNAWPPIPSPEPNQIAKRFAWQPYLEHHRQQLERWGQDKSAWIRLPVLLFMAYLSIRYLANAEYRSIFDGINLGIHEAGHLLFAPFPTFLTFLGGTITQLAAPVICGYMLYRQGDYFGIAFCGTWLSANAYHVAIYQADAQARVLPLVTVGGGIPIHDWHYMLDRLGLLTFDSHIAWLTRCFGFLVGWGSVAYAAWILKILRKQEAAVY